MSESQMDASVFLSILTSDPRISILYPINCLGGEPSFDILRNDFQYYRRILCTVY